MGYEFRSVKPDEVAAFRVTTYQGFGDDARPDDQERFLTLMPLDRTVAAFDDGALVASLGDFDLRLFVPGGARLPMAGTSMVAVRPTHRRRGILRELMRVHLDNAVARGEPLAGLWASEPAIYGRFGFGLSVECHEIKADARHLDVPAPDADLVSSLVDATDLQEVAAPFWASVAAHRAGFLDREPARWDSIIADPENRRDGGSSLRHVVVRRDAEVVGYLAYRQSRKWTDGVPEGSVLIQDLVGADIAAHRALWHYATNVDLFPMVTYWNAAVDDTITLETGHSRSVRRLVTDTLYMRILDLGAALSARTYEANGELVLRVVDDMGYAEDTIRLSVVGGSAMVESTTSTPHVTLDVRELSALYLGRDCAGPFAQTGRLVGSPEAVRVLAQLFRTQQAPWCPEMF